MGHVLCSIVVGVLLCTVVIVRGDDEKIAVVEKGLLYRTNTRFGRPDDLLDVSHLPSTRPATDSEFRLIIKKAQLIQDDMRAAYASGDEKRGKSLAEEARRNLVVLAVNPDLSSVEAWRLLGICALMLDDYELGSFSYEAISRLDPQFGNDDTLLTLMARLARGNVIDRVREIEGFHEKASRIWSNAISGRSESMVELGRLLKSGRYVIREDDEAVRWFAIASINDNEDALNELLHCISASHCSEARWKELCVALETRGECGDGVDVYVLGRLVEAGIPTSYLPPDLAGEPNLARRLYKLAAFHKNDKAERRLKEQATTKLPAKP